MEVRKETTPMAWLFLCLNGRDTVMIPAAASENTLQQKTRKKAKKTGKKVKKVRKMTKKQ